jgi:hypothetical protein
MKEQVKQQHIPVKIYQTDERLMIAALFFVQDTLLVQFLPVGFTACKHATYESKDDTDGSDTSNN